MTDLSTSYLGLSLDSPLVPSASPLSRSLDNLRRMEDAGAGAVVLHSLFEEQITLEGWALNNLLDHRSQPHWEASSYYPEPGEFALAPEEYLEHLRAAKHALGIPVIASLNGFSARGCVRYARLLQDAGADALELNVYFVPTDPFVDGSVIEESTLRLMREVRAAVSIPLAVKLSPFYTNLSIMARRLAMFGANGLVLFNRFNQPDIDLDLLEISPKPLISRSGEEEALRLPLRWIGLLHDRVKVDYAATGGVHEAKDVLKLLMVGASVTMLASELLLNGIERLSVIRSDMERWMEEREYESVAQMRGSLSHTRAPDPDVFERAQYVRTVGLFPGPPGFTNALTTGTAGMSAPGDVRPPSHRALRAGDSG